MAATPPRNPLAVGYLPPYPGCNDPQSSTAVFHFYGEGREWVPSFAYAHDFLAVVAISARDTWAVGTTVGGSILIRSLQIEGYCSAASVRAGDTFTLHVSTNPVPGLVGWQTHGLITDARPVEVVAAGEVSYWGTGHTQPRSAHRPRQRRLQRRDHLLVRGALRAARVQGTGLL